MRLIAKAAEASDKKTANDMQMLTAYVKPFVGPAWRGDTVESRVRFYDEREWRYVPRVRGKYPLLLERSVYENKARRKALDDRMKREYALGIDPESIQYLIVPYDREEENIMHLHRFLMRLFPRKDAILVTTAIMTDDCIRNDV